MIPTLGRRIAVRSSSGVVDGGDMVASAAAPDAAQQMLVTVRAQDLYRGVSGCLREVLHAQAWGPGAPA
jgi:hypothetical protein